MNRSMAGHPVHHKLPEFTQTHPSSRWCRALESITTNEASGGDGIPVELFQILKEDAVKVLHTISQQIWKTQQWPQDWNRSVFIPIPKKGNPKECSNYCTIALISHASKVMLRILQASLQQYVNRELPDAQASRVTMIKNPPANAGDIRDAGLIPGWGRVHWGGHGNPLQYSCLEKPMDRGAGGLGSIG